MSLVLLYLVSRWLRLQYMVSVVRLELASRYSLAGSVISSKST